jgi:hypothetical protein
LRSHYRLNRFYLVEFVVLTLITLQVQVK